MTADGRESAEARGVPSAAELDGVRKAVVTAAMVIPLDHDDGWPGRARFRHAVAGFMGCFRERAGAIRNRVNAAFPFPDAIAQPGPPPVGPELEAVMRAILFFGLGDLDVVPPGRVAERMALTLGLRPGTGVPRVGKDTDAVSDGGDHGGANGPAGSVFSKYGLVTVRGDIGHISVTIDAVKLGRLVELSAALDIPVQELFGATLARAIDGAIDRTLDSLRIRIVRDHPLTAD
jgi:hypothetical protein